VHTSAKSQKNQYQQSTKQNTSPIILAFRYWHDISRDLFDCIGKGLDFCFANIINGFGINIKVLMRDDVSQAFGFFPFDLGVFR